MQTLLEEILGTKLNVELKVTVKFLRCFNFLNITISRGTSKMLNKNV